MARVPRKRHRRRSVSASESVRDMTERERLLRLYNTLSSLALVCSCAQSRDRAEPQRSRVGRYRADSGVDRGLSAFGRTQI